MYPSPENMPVEGFNVEYQQAGVNLPNACSVSHSVLRLVRNDQNRNRQWFNKFLTTSLTLLAVLSYSTAFAAGRYRLDALDYNPTTQALTLKGNGPIKATVNSVNIGSNKRIILDIEDAAVGSIPRDTLLLQQLSKKWPAVKNITVNQFGGSRPVVRILLDVEGLDYRTTIANNQTQLVQVKVESSGPAPGTPQPMQTTGPARINNIQTNKAIARPVYTQSPSAKAADDIQELKQTLLAMNQKYDQLMAENVALKKQGTINSAPNKAQAYTPVELQQLRTANNNLQSQIFKMQQEKEFAQKNMAQLQSQLKQPQKTSQAVATNTPITDPQLVEMKRQLDQAKTALNRSITTINEQSRETAALKKQVEQMNVVGDANAKDQITLLNNKLDQKDDEIKSLRQQSAVQSKVANSSSSEDLSQDPLLQDMRGQIQEKDRLITELKNQLAGKKTTLPTERQSERQMAEENTAKIKSLSRELEASRNKATTAQSELEKTKLELVDVKQNASLALSQNTSPETSKQQSEPPTKEKPRQASLVSENKRLRSELSALKKDSKDVDGLREQIKHLSQERDEILQNEKTLTNKLVTLQKESSPQKEVATNQTELPVNAQIKSLRSELENLKRDKANLSTVNESLFAELSAEKEKSARKTGGMAKENKAPNDLEQSSQLIALNNQISNLEAKIDDLNQQNRSLSADLQQTQKTDPALVSQKASASGASADKLTIAALKKQLNESQAKLVDTDKRYKKILVEYDKSKRLTPVTDGKPQPVNKPQAIAAVPSEMLLEENKVLKSQLQEALDSAKSLEGDLAEMKRIHLDRASNSNSVAEAQPEPKKPDLKKNVLTPTPVLVPGEAPTAEAEKHFKLGQSFEKNNQAATALDEYRRAAQLEPANERYVFATASTLADQQRYLEASRMLQQYIDTQPYNAEAYSNLGKIYLLNNQVEEAKIAFAKSIPTGSLSNYATTLKKQGKLPEAEHVFKMALDMNPNDSEVIFNLGNIYNSQNNLEEAKVNYIKALNINPNFAEAHYNLGLVCSKLGDKQNAVSHLEKFLSLTPTAANADAIRGYIKKLKG